MRFERLPLGSGFDVQAHARTVGPRQLPSKLVRLMA
jgi:hypothetical protein